MNKKIESIMISSKYTIRETMKIITGAASRGAPTGIALVVNNNKKLLGIVTDGDIRRALVNDVDIDSAVENIMINDPITVPKDLSETKMIELVTKKVETSGRIRDVKVDQVIIVDKDGRVDDVLNFFELWKGSDVKNKTVCVIGLGFVGLTLSIVLADAGFKVIGYDINKEVVNHINTGRPHFYEKGLPSLLKFHVARGNLRADSDLTEGKADIYILSVSTPIGKNRKPNLDLLRKATRKVGKVLKKRDTVILRSTVPVGTTRNLVLPILEEASGLKADEDFYLSFAPERTVEGNALEELRSIPQVMGGLNKRSLDESVNFFSYFNNTVVRVPSLEAAEMVKLINNSFRDLSFGFANELALICDRWGLDAVNIVKAANEGYPRNPIPVPSPGVGGVCLKKDPYLYAHSAEKVEHKAEISLMSRKINEYMPMFIVRKVESFMKRYKNNANDVKVFIIGFAFKGEPETSDTRGSTAIDLVNLIKDKTTWRLTGYDPVVSKEVIESNGVAGASLREGFKGADCVLIMNNHRSYLDMDILGLTNLMSKPALLFDCWHLFPCAEIERVEGIVYEGLSGKN